MLSVELKRHSCERLEHYMTQIERCAALLSTDELWYRPNEQVNSAANLILHLTGNVTQWINAGLGDDSFERDRPAEFAARGARPASEIVPPLRAAVERAIEVIQSLDDHALARVRQIQRYTIPAQTAVLHVVEHFAFHAGQIVHATKWIKAVDLSLYDAQGQRLDRSGHP
jgi:uncharacterized damage-inducible protein DinB